MAFRTFFKSEFFIISLVLGALLILFFSEPIFSDKAAAPTKLLQRHPPFRGQHLEHTDSYNLMAIDPVLQFHPWLEFQAEAIRQGRLPLWNPWSAAGLPHIANGQSATFFPLTLLFYILELPQAILLNLFLKLYLTGLLTYYYLRQIKLSYAAALFGAVVYMFCGFQVVWLSWPNTNVSLFLPALFLWIERATTLQRPVAAYFLLTITWALQFLSGHFQMSLIIAVAAGFYFVYKIVVLYLNRSDFRLVLNHIMAFGLSGLLGLALAAIQLLPFVEYLLQSQVLVVRSNFGHNPYVLPWSYLFLFLVPNLYGHPVDEWAVANYNETNMGYVGIFTLVLALLALLHRQRHQGQSLRFFFLGLALFCGALVYGGWPVFDIAASLSLFKMMGVNRFLMVVAFSLAVLGALGVEHLTRSDRPTWIRLGAALLPVGLGLIAAPLEHVPPNQAFYVYTYLSLAVIFVISGALLVILRRLDRLSFRLTAIFLTLLVAGDLILMFGRRYQTTTSPELFYPSNPVVTLLQDHTDVERVTFAFDPQIPHFPPNLSLYYRLYDIRSYDAMGLHRYENLVQTLAPVEWNWSWWDLTSQGDNDRLLDLLNVKYFMTTRDEYPGFRLETVQGMYNTPVGELAGDYEVGQTFKAQADYLAGLELKLATFMRRNNQDVYVHLKKHPEAKEILRTTRVNAAQMSDNEPFLFTFEPLPDSANQAYYFYLESPTSSQGNAISFWASDEDLYSDGAIYIQGQPLPGDAHFRLAYGNKSTLPAYRLIHTAAEIKIFENVDVLPRAFIVPQAKVVTSEAKILAQLRDKNFDLRSAIIVEDKTALWDSYSSSDPATTVAGPGQVEIEVYQPSEIVMKANAPYDGYLFLSDVYYPGWQAWVDDQAQPIYRANYTFRAVKLPAGQHEVRFVYDPASFKIGLWLTVLSGIAMIVLGRVLGPSSKMIF